MRSPKDFYVRIHIQKIYDIQPCQDLFKAIYVLQITWKDDKFKNCQTPPREEIEQLKKNPPAKIFLSNTVEELSREDDVMVYKSVYNLCLVRLISKIRAVLSFKSSSLLYPFEELQLPFYVTTNSATDEVVFLTDPLPSRINIASDSKWFFKKKVKMKRFYTDQVPHGGLSCLPMDYTDRRHPVLKFTVTATRMLSLFYCLYFAQQSILGLCSLTVFCINPTLVHFRLITSMIFMIILLAFKVITPTSNKNPINYLELSFWLNWTIQAVLMLWHFSIKNLFTPQEILYRIDKLLAVITLFIYVLQNVIVIPLIHKNIFTFQILLFKRWIPNFVSLLNRNSAFESSVRSSNYVSDDSAYGNRY